MSLDAFKQQDSSLTEIEEMDVILEELSTYDKEADKYRKQVIDLVQDAYQLYLPTQVIEQDDTCKNNENCYCIPRPVLASVVLV